MVRTAKRRRAASVALIAVLALGAAVQVDAQTPDEEAEERGSSEGALFLLLPVGAKAVALGRAVTALPGSESVWWNPAGLAWARDRSLLLYGGDHQVGEATAVSLVLTREALGALGVSYQLLDLGDQDVTDVEGNVVGALHGRNHLGIVTLATDMGERLSLGVNLKLVRARFSCVGQCTDAGVTATTFAVDAGVQFHGLADALRIGAMVAHAGSDLQVLNEEQADPLPTRIRVAVGYEVLRHFLDSDEVTFSLDIELEDRWRDPGSPATYIGTQVTVGSGDVLYVRSGYVFGAEQQVDGWAVGVGVRYERFDLGLAKSLASRSFAGSTEPVHISFGLVF